jgi:hypothetical protein
VKGDDGVKKGDTGHAAASWQKGEDGGGGVSSRRGGEDGEAPTSSSSAMKSMRGDSAGAMVVVG